MQMKSQLCHRDLKSDTDEPPATQQSLLSYEPDKKPKLKELFNFIYR